MTRWDIPAAFAAVVGGAFLASTPANAETDGTSYIDVIETCVQLATDLDTVATFEEDLDKLGFSAVREANSEMIAQAFGIRPSSLGWSIYSADGFEAKMLAPEILERNQAYIATDLAEVLARKDNDGPFAFLPKAYPVYQNSDGAIALAMGGGLFGNNCALALPLHDAVIDHFDIPINESTARAGYMSMTTRRLFRTGAIIEFIWYAPSLAESANIMPLQVQVRQDL